MYHAGNESVNFSKWRRKSAATLELRHSLCAAFNPLDLRKTGVDLRKTGVPLPPPPPPNPCVRFCIARWTE